MNIQEFYYVIHILILLFGLGVGWGYVKTKLKVLEENCKTNRESCLLRMSEHNRFVESEIVSIKESIERINSTLSNFMLTINEWKGVISQQIEDNTKNINGLKKKFNGR